MLNDTSCFPEIAEDAGVYFHSRPDEKSSDLYEKMRQLYIMSQEERKDLITKVKKRGAFFSWDKSSKELADVYLSVLNR